MGNLGWYQVMTTMAKKVGGPKNLLGITIGVGTALGIGVTKGTQAIMKRINSNLDEKKKAAESAVTHTVYKEGSSNEGLNFKAGDEFKVLERDGDAALIEKIGDENNPYFVSAKFLSSISDYSFA